jgi:ethanolamine ammonia-lyase small subunit
MERQQLERIVREVVQGMLPEITVQGSPIVESAAHSISGTTPAGRNGVNIDIDVPDITTMNLRETLLVKNPKDREAYMDLKKASPARLGVGRAGARQHTTTLLRLRADHAAAMDTVRSDVDESVFESLDIVMVKSTASNKSEYLMNPGAGKVFDPETARLIKEKCKAAPQIQIIVSDGLSSVAVENNIRDVIPSVLQGLKGNGLEVGTSIFVKLGRVGIMDAVCDILHPEVAILFIGERAGLVTNDSLSCYMTYKGYQGMAENGRTVISNIYKNGTPPVEAGAHIADIAKLMILKKASGLDLKL